MGSREGLVVVKLTTKQISLMTVLAAMYYLVNFLPGVPIVGTAGGQIKPSMILGPVYGMALGPWLGTVTAFLGALLAWMIPPGAPNPFSFLMGVPPPTVSAFVAGALTRTKMSIGFSKVKIPGWALSSTVLALLIAGWYFTWVGQQAPFYPVLQFAGLTLALALGWKVGQFYEGGDRRRLTVAVALASYCGVIADHMIGNIAFIESIGWFIPWEFVQGMLADMGLLDVPSLFMFMLPVSTVERVVLAVLTTFVGVAVIVALRLIGFMPSPKLTPAPAGSGELVKT